MLHQKRPSLHHKPERLLENMKIKYPNVKAALVKASMAEQEEAKKDYKRAFDLYKEAVEIMMPIAEGTYIHVATQMHKLNLTNAECSLPVEKGVIKSEVSSFSDL